MTFDVTKFLALTAVLAGASIGVAACSSNNDDDANNNGGSSGSSGSSSGSNAGGDNGNAGGSSAKAGDGNSPGGDGGVGGGVGGSAGGADAAGATNGGASTAGAGGEAGGGACLATDPAYEDDPCSEIPETQCDGAEEGFSNPFYDLCYSSYGANTAVRIAFAECVSGDVCRETAAADAVACWTAPAAKACAVEGSAAACTTAVGTCDEGLTEASCTEILDTTASFEADYIASCMDPAGEFWEESFEGDCAARLRVCASLPPL